jgi:hypothetical protein
VEGENSSMIYLIHCKNLCKWHNVPTPSTTIKDEKEKKKKKRMARLSLQKGLKQVTSSPYKFRFQRKKLK